MTAADHTPEPTRDGALGEAEREALREAHWPVDPPNDDNSQQAHRRIAAAVERIVAARVARVEAERDELLRGSRCPECSATEWNAASMARAERDRLRAGIEALADEWDDPDPERGDPDRADLLRALLAQPATGATS